MTERPPPEEYEFIPWSELTARERSARPWTIYLMAAAITVGALGLAGARLLRRPAPVAPPTTVAEVVAATSPAPTLYAEADLMASLPGDDARAAATRAEWFVIDYFTADGGPGGAGEVRSVLPPEAVPPIPHEDSSAGLSYVEWARALSVEPAGPMLYRVVVVFRTLGALPENPFRRLPVRTVEVVVRVDPEGGTGVLDLPTPVTLAGLVAAFPPDEGEEPPAAVLEQALASAAAWGEDPGVLDARRIGEGWRIVVEVLDPAGIRWPLALWMGDGTDLAVPSWHHNEG